MNNDSQYRSLSLQLRQENISIIIFTNIIAQCLDNGLCHRLEEFDKIVAQT